MITRGLLRGLLVVLMALLLASSGVAQAAVTVDAVSETNVNDTVMTWRHTVGAVSDGLLLVGVSIRDATKTVTGVTYGGQALTLLGTRNSDDNSVRIELWYLLAPAAGTADVTVTLSTKGKMVGGAVSYGGVDPSSPFGPFVSTISAGQGTSDPTLTLFSTSGDLVQDVVVVEGSAQALTAGPGQTERWNGSFAPGGGAVGGGALAGGGSTAPGAASVTMSWTKAKKGRWVIGALSIHPTSRATLDLLKTVSATAARPGEDITYTVAHTNPGPVDIFPTFTTDPVPAFTDYRLGSATFSPGASGLSAVVEFSDDGGSSYGYLPQNQGGGAPPGYDRNVTHVRYAFAGTLGSIAPGTTFEVSFTVRIR